MEGWKTWVGVAGLFGGAVATALGYVDTATTIYEFTMPMVALGLGHKLDKVRAVLHGIGVAATDAEAQLDKVSKGV